MSSSLPFFFRGVIPASKSIMNRALVCSSFADQAADQTIGTEKFQLTGSSTCDDVQKMQVAITQLSTQLNAQLNSTQIQAGPAVYDCGAAGTVLRFLSLRLSRIPGTHVLKGTERLLRRPQQDLLDLFSRLGVEYKLSAESLILKSDGWKNLDHSIVVQRTVSSQFASGLVLNAWNLEQDLVLEFAGEPMSEGYLQMTLELVQYLGMNIEKTQSGLIIKAGSKISKKNYQVESDLSSLFAVAAFAVLNGQADFLRFPQPSLQPDSEFLDFFKKMGIRYELNDDILQVFATPEFNGIEANIRSCPDLFPVFAVLCASAKSPSRLFGAPQLVHKESDRIAKVAELLNSIGVKNDPLPDGMVIYPREQTLRQPQILPFEYDTDHDHRLAFAAGLVKAQGLPIQIKHPEVVNKSFPEFWQVIGLDPA